MKALSINSEFGLDNLQWTETDQPELKANEVLVESKAMALNYLDILVAKGMFQNPLPHAIGSDVAGVVIDTGSNVKEFSKGDRVVSHYTQDWQSGEIKEEYLASRLGVETSGIFAEQITLPEKSWLKIPDTLSYPEAASQTIAGLTAYEALFNIGQLKAGETVYLQGSGGVSMAALQLAKAANARVIISTGSSQKESELKTLGADHVINYNSEPLSKIKSITVQRGVDLAVDVVGSSLADTLNITAYKGRVVNVGFLGGTESKVDASKIIMKNLKIEGVQVGSKSSYKDLLDFIVKHNLSPVINKRFALEDYRDAFKYLQEGEHIGKVVLTNE